MRGCLFTRRRASRPAHACASVSTSKFDRYTSCNEDAVVYNDDGRSYDMAYTHQNATTNELYTVSYGSLCQLGESGDTPGRECGDIWPGPSFAYSLPVHSFHTRRDRVASLTACRLHGAAIQRASPLGPGQAEP